MAKNQEIELKLQVMDAAVWPELCKFMKALEGEYAPEKINLAANYFDTVDGALAKEKVAYRVRRENEVWVATIKSGGSDRGGLHQRKEWNVEVKSGAADLSVFKQTDIDQALLARLTKKQLIPVVQTTFVRLSMLLSFEGSVIEAALDRGMIMAVGKQVPILEVELELKQGSPAELLKFGARLARQYPLVLERKSKFLRGLLLAGRVKEKEPKMPEDNESMVAIYHLITLIYEEWVNGKAIDRKVYENNLKTLHKIFTAPEARMELKEWLERVKSGEQFDRQHATATLLTLWSSVMLVDFN